MWKMNQIYIYIYIYIKHKIQYKVKKFRHSFVEHKEDILKKVVIQTTLDPTDFHKTENHTGMEQHEN